MSFIILFLKHSKITVLSFSLILLSVCFIHCCNPYRQKPVDDTPHISVNPVSFDVGTDVMFTCSTNKEEYLEWEYMEKVLSTNYSVTATKLFLTVEEFDNGKEINCTVRRKKGHSSNTLYRIITSNSLSKETPYDDMVFYNNDNTFNVIHNCNQNNNQATNEREYKVVYIINNTIIRTYTVTKEVKEIFSQNDSGTILSCIYYEYENNAWRRHVQQKIMYIHENNDFRQNAERNINNSSVQYNNNISDYTGYYIGSAGLFALIVIIVTILLMIKRTRHETKEATPHADPSIVYAELELSSIPHSARVSEIDDSPYAQIINPDTVTYAQLDLSASYCNKPLHTEESPYAEVMHYNYRK